MIRFYIIWSNFSSAAPMFYGVSWEGVSLRQFISILDSYLHWYNRERIKQSLGWRSPMDFRRSLGLTC